MTKLKAGFDDGFLWGGAISCSQADGGWKQGGKGTSTQDLRYLDPSWDHERVELKHHGNPFSREEFEAALADEGTEFYPNRRGIDFYHRYKDDIELFGEMSPQAVPHLNLLEPHLSQRR